MAAQDADSKSTKRKAPRRRADNYIEELVIALERRLEGERVDLPAPPAGEALARRLHAVLRRMGSGSGNVEAIATKVQEVAAGLMSATSEQASSAAEQAASVSEITTTIQELNEVAVQNVEKAEGIIELAQQSEQISQDGQRDVVTAVEGMDALGRKVEQIASTILDLTERTQQIGEIIATVNEIAEQSKLLALNASIEAARAGEHGRGFSVVALEIRNLADQSKQATKQVRSILSEIQKASHSAAMATEEGSHAAAEGSTKVRRIGERLGQLVYVITQASRASRQINAAMKQQSAGLDQIARAMRHINESTQLAKVGIDRASTSLRTLSELTTTIASGGPGA